MFRNISINQGQSFYHEFQLVDPSGNPIDISGYTISGRMKHHVESIIFVDFDCVITDGPNGKYSIRLTDMQTDILSKPTYIYTTQGISGSQTDRLHEGTAFISFGTLHPQA